MVEFNDEFVLVIIKFTNVLPAGKFTKGKLNIDTGVFGPENENPLNKVVPPMVTVNMVPESYDDEGHA
jgi:hypothetical protein